MRIGLAHGSITEFGASGESANLIPPDCATSAGLDYLALVDWHGYLPVGDRTAYSGTPEIDRFEGMEGRTRAGNEPDGFTARYRVRGPVIQVVFRVLDLGQERLRHAAASSAQPVNVPSLKPRAKKATS